MINFIKMVVEWLKGFGKPMPNEPVLEVTNPPITMSPEGVKILKYFESCKLEAYWDKLGKVWTIGWGHTGPEVRKGLKITQARADQLLRDRLSHEFTPGVLAVLSRSVKQHELDAMVDLAYNIGVEDFADSTLVLKFNRGETQATADEFRKWKFADGKPRLGLRRRREADRARFLGASGESAIQIGAAVK